MEDLKFDKLKTHELQCLERLDKRLKVIDSKYKKEREWQMKTLKLWTARRLNINCLKLENFMFRKDQVWCLKGCKLHVKKQNRELTTSSISEMFPAGKSPSFPPSICKGLLGSDLLSVESDWVSAELLLALFK